eukprot:7054488-Lingulodinium_polyedra.AAC.1
MQAIVRVHGVAVQDDRHPAKAWVLPAIQLKCTMVQQVLPDPAWELQAAFDEQVVAQWLRARA